MTDTHTDQAACNVMVRITAGPDWMNAIMRESRLMVPVFARQTGFVSISLYVSETRDEAIFILQWRSKSDHEACQQNPEVHAAGQDWMSLLQTSGATIEVKVLDLLEVARAA